jgi:hypothetical protein
VALSGDERKQSTFRVVFVGILQVLHDTILTDDLFNLLLGLDIEGIIVEQLHLFTSLTLSGLGLLDGVDV